MGDIFLFCFMILNRVIRDAMSQSILVSFKNFIFSWNLKVNFDWCKLQHTHGLSLFHQSKWINILYLYVFVVLLLLLFSFLFHWQFRIFNNDLLVPILIYCQCLLSCAQCWVISYSKNSVIILRGRCILDVWQAGQASTFPAPWSANVIKKNFEEWQFLKRQIMHHFSHVSQIRSWNYLDWAE